MPQFEPEHADRPMEMFLFILLIGVWAAFVLPSFMYARRETPVDRTTQTGGTEAALHRQRVLTRRKMALIALAGLAVGLLVAAVLTGSWALLIATLVVDVMLATYIAILLQIKQRKASQYWAESGDTRDDMPIAYQ